MSSINTEEADVLGVVGALVLTKKLFNSEAFKRTMCNLWKFWDGLSIKRIDLCALSLAEIEVLVITQHILSEYGCLLISQNNFEGVHEFNWSSEG